MTEILTGLSLGLAAGLAPGPLQALVVTSTLQRGFGAGRRVAVAPVLTDVPIVAVVLAVLAAIPSGVVRGVGLAGGITVIGLGLWEARTAFTDREAVPVAATPAGGRDLLRGALVNVLNPHPWLFWAGVGGPILVEAWRSAPAVAVGFLVAFYGLLVGSKVALAAVVAAGRSRMTGPWRRRTLLTGAVFLMAAGVLLVLEFA